MVVLFLFFGYQKWFEYEAVVLIPYITHDPLIFWMYPVFGIQSPLAELEGLCSAGCCRANEAAALGNTLRQAAWRS